MAAPLYFPVREDRRCFNTRELGSVTMTGLSGKGLLVDLDEANITELTIAPRALAQFIGGKGLAVYLLLRMLQPDTDPLSPQNKAVFAAGPASGADLAGAGFAGVFAKSPLTGRFTGGCTGGPLGNALRGTGYDAVVISGAASRPTFVHISPAGVGFYDASALWGLDTGVSARTLLEAVGMREAVAAVIGPAGEKMLPYALLRDSAGRCWGREGIGAVLGAKNLKGIVFSGPGSLKHAGRAGSAPQGHNACGRNSLPAGAVPGWERPPGLRPLEELGLGRLETDLFKEKCDEWGLDAAAAAGLSRRAMEAAESVAHCPPPRPGEARPHLAYLEAVLEYGALPSGGQLCAPAANPWGPGRENGCVMRQLEEEDRNAVCDALMVCRRLQAHHSWENLLRLALQLTGDRPGLSGLRLAAGRIEGAVRFFNMREKQFGGEDQALSGSAAAAARQRGGEIRRRAGEYNLLRGWSDNGVPPHPEAGD